MAGRILQAIGADDVEISELNLHRPSAPDMSTPGSSYLYPLLISDDGAWAMSKILTWRLHVTGINGIHSAQFWFGQMSIPTGWDVRVAIGPSRDPGAYLPGATITAFMNQADIDDPGAIFNLMPNYTTDTMGGANTPHVGHEYLSPYVHLWAQANMDSALGPVSPSGIPVNLSWIET